MGIEWKEKYCHVMDVFPLHVTDMGIELERKRLSRDGRFPPARDWDRGGIKKKTFIM
jgi:hypothetical protein